MLQVHNYNYNLHIVDKIKKAAAAYPKSIIPGKFSSKLFNIDAKMGILSELRVNDTFDLLIEFRVNLFFPFFKSF